MAYLVDTHCHLDLFEGIRSKVEQEDGLPIKTITVTNAPSIWEPNEKLFGKCQNIRVGLGLHPELATQREREIDVFNKLCSKSKYIGEIGLDGTSKEKNVRDAQLRVFRNVLKSIKDSNPKILTVHSRGAARETIDELSNVLRGGQHQVILHWYSGELSELKRAMGLEYFFSVNHKMVASKNGLSIIKSIKIANLLTETDAPFTFTDRIKNRVQSLEDTLSRLSKELNLSIEQTKQIIWENFKTILQKSK